MGHSLLKNSFPETNRKCPRWEEFNSGAAPGPSAAPAASPSATSPPGTPSIGFNRSFGLSSATSPLATSPPMTPGFDDTPSSAPKIKLNLGKKG